MVTCVVKDCEERHEKGNNVSFHRFPMHNPELLEIWTKFVKRKNWSANPSSRICCKHFAPDAYKTSRVSGLKILKTDSVPSIEDTSRWTPLPSVFPDLPSSSFTQELSTDTDIGLEETVTTSQVVAKTFIGDTKSENKKIVDQSLIDNLDVQLPSGGVKKLKTMEKYCRFCFKIAIYPYINIFEDTKDSKEVKLMCTVVLPSEMLLNSYNVVPHNICFNCHYELKKCYETVTKFIKSEFYLQKLVADIEHPDSKDEKPREVPIKKTPLRWLSRNILPGEQIQASHSSSQPEKLVIRPQLKPEACKLSSTHRIQPQVHNTPCLSKKLPAKRPIQPEVSEPDPILIPYQPFESVDVYSTSIHEDLPDNPSDGLNAENPSVNQFIDNSPSCPVEPTIPPLADHDYTNLTMKKLSYTRRKPGRKRKNQTTATNKTVEDNITDHPSEEIKVNDNITDHPSDEIKAENGVKPVPESVPTPQKFKCTICSRHFKSLLSLDNHKKNHTCEQCGSNTEIFKTRQEFETHLNENHKLECQHCQQVFFYPARLEKHVYIKHRVDCRFCGKVFKAARNRANHENISHLISPQVCYICGKYVKRMTFHLKTHEKHLSNPCKICGETFESRYSRIHHMEINHPEVFVHKNRCDLCFEGFTTKKKLLNHTELYHSKTKELKYTCQGCGERFLNIIRYEKHKLKLKKRGFCAKVRNAKAAKFISRAERRKIIARWRANKKPVLKDVDDTCEICHRKFLYRKNLERHRKFHSATGDKEIVDKLLNEPEVHKCDDCGERVRSKLCLMEHRVKHTNETKPYECEFCGRKFACRNQYLVDERTHAGYHPYSCQHCGQAFVTPLRLKCHEKKHKQEQLSCTLCSKTFKYRIYYEKHVRLGICKGKRGRRELEVKNFPCLSCEKKFATKAGRKKHTMKCHSDVFSGTDSEQIRDEERPNQSQEIILEDLEGFLSFNVVSKAH